MSFLPMAALDIFSWSIVDRSIAITVVGSAIAIIRISSQIYSNCPVVITVATIVTPTMTVTSMASRVSTPPPALTIVDSERRVIGDR